MSSPTPVLSTPPSSGPNVSFIRSCLHRQLRVSLSDGRIVEGTLECFDDSGNMILSCTTDVSAKVHRFRGSVDQRTYRMGTVLVPGHHQVSILLRRDQDYGASRITPPLGRLVEIGESIAEHPAHGEVQQGSGSEGEGE
eukprot:GFKZ01001659.1.p2 GENE.GFKZ01001659.1~~GFKZ01001659.1.p2  ORF type:complete len:139 (-),score=16.00 GFKZ01001659.1:1404-1820(-)